MVPTALVPTGTPTDCPGHHPPQHDHAGHPDPAPRPPDGAEGGAPGSPALLPERQAGLALGSETAWPAPGRAGGMVLSGRRPESLCTADVTQTPGGRQLRRRGRPVRRFGRRESGRLRPAGSGGPALSPHSHSPSGRPASLPHPGSTATCSAPVTSRLPPHCWPHLFSPGPWQQVNVAPPAPPGFARGHSFPPETPTKAPQGLQVTREGDAGRRGLDDEISFFSFFCSFDKDPVVLLSQRTNKHFRVEVVRIGYP